MTKEEAIAKFQHSLTLKREMMKKSTEILEKLQKELDTTGSYTLI